jgi:hypothetical protein
MREPPRQHMSVADVLVDFRLLLYLFVGLRLMLAFVYQPFIFDLYEADGTPAIAERGMTSFGDFRYFYAVARLSDDGDWPYRDYWYEHPPVSSALFIGVYKLLGLFGGAEYRLWAFVAGVILLVVDVGNLILLRDLGRHLHGESTAAALSWFYALLAAPLILPWWTFETLVVFLMLLALLWLLRGRQDRPAVITALGLLTKYTPVLILPAVWRFYGRRYAIRYTGVTLLIAACGLGLMIAWGGRMAVSSLLAQFHKASYQTVWALVDGNTRTGRLVDLQARYDPDTAYEPYGHAAVIPSGVRLIPFAGMGLYVFTRRLRQDDQGVVAFFALTAILFFLWAQGWSPQWVLTLTPLILLNFPTREGVLVCLLISLASFVEYPVLFMYTGAADGEITGNRVPLYVMLILVRTALLVALVVALYRRLTQKVETYA